MIFEQSPPIDQRQTPPLPDIQTANINLLQGTSGGGKYHKLLQEQIDLEQKI